MSERRWGDLGFLCSKVLICGRKCIGFFRLGGEGRKYRVCIFGYFLSEEGIKEEFREVVGFFKYFVFDGG